MKKIKLILLFSACALIFASCSNSDTINNSSGSADSQIQNRNNDTGIDKMGTNDVIAAEDGGNYSALSEASTRLIDKSENRVHNIKTASEKLKGIVIAPETEFSFNQVVGERSEENGYKKAAALLYDKRVYEVGGGVCQVSSTIYQAALNAGLEVVERNPHKKKVNYAEEGKDACVEYGKLDLKLRNNTSKNIILKVSCDGNYVYASFES